MMNSQTYSRNGSFAHSFNGSDNSFADVFQFIMWTSRRAFIIKFVRYLLSLILVVTQYIYICRYLQFSDYALQGVYNSYFVTTFMLKCSILTLFMLLYLNPQNYLAKIFLVVAKFVLALTLEISLVYFDQMSVGSYKFIRYTLRIEIIILQLNLAIMAITKLSITIIEPNHNTFE